MFDASPEQYARIESGKCFLSDLRPGDYFRADDKPGRALWCFLGYTDSGRIEVENIDTNHVTTSAPTIEVHLVEMCEDLTCGYPVGTCDTCLAS